MQAPNVQSNNETDVTTIPQATSQSDNSIPSDISLLEGEKVEQILRPTWRGNFSMVFFNLFWAIPVFIIAIIISGVALANPSGYCDPGEYAGYSQSECEEIGADWDYDDPGMDFYSSIMVAVIVLLSYGGILFTVFAKVRGHSYILTNRRIIGRYDFISHNESTVYYERIQNMTVRQGFIDNMLSTGAIFIQTASGGAEAEENLVGISNPREVRALLMNLIENLSQSGGKVLDDGLGVSPTSQAVGGMAAPPVVSSQYGEETMQAMLVELRTIRALLEK
ncbi:MAG: hypothetical protein CXX80_05155 [Methanobacteriota archaeon]|nr:MAG: hypothetical protein CXX80_11340 [Euryarchaeota archaeon]PXY75257.1 MAG: hypothetical protein CXX80_05155 [Euryarchaeota archaeon]